MAGRMAGIARRGTAVVAVALALGVGAAGAGAQAAAQERGGGAVVGYGATGVSRIATGDLNDRLAARGYPALGSTAVGVSIGAYLRLEGGLMLGGEWTGLIMGEEKHDGRDLGLGGGYGTLGVGYEVELSPRVRVYPRLGLGGGGFGLWIDRAGGAVGFDDVLADPERYADPDTAGDPGAEVVMNHGSMVVDLGGGAEFLPGGWGRGLLIGVRLGYLATPFAGDWRMDERPVTGGPDATIAGPYIRLMIGGGPRW